MRLRRLLSWFVGIRRIRCEGVGAGPLLTRLMAEALA